MLFISLTICTLANFQVKAQSATVWTDKADYYPGETVTIYGTGFLPDANVAVNVTAQSEGTVSSFTAISDPNGNFTTSYQIDDVGVPLFTVTATDGSNTATTTFTDSIFGIDTNCEGFGSISSSQSTPITTTPMTAQANELIIIVITQGNLGHRTFEHFTITDSFSTHLSYTQRGTTLKSYRNAEAISEYYAVTSSSQTGSFRITVIPSRHNHNNIDVQVFGILGANTASPFDARTGLPYKGHSTGSSVPTVTGVSTANANDIILGLEGNSGSTAETPGSYFTGAILHNVNGEGDNVGYKTVTSTLSSSNIAFGTSVTYWVMYVDTVKQALSVSVSPTSWTMDVGQSKTFTAAPSGGSGTYTSYQWYVDGEAQIGATASTFSYTPATAGSHSITVTATDSLGATSPQSAGVTVTVNPTLVAPTASATKGTIDLGQTSALSSTAVSTGTGPYTYQWLGQAPGASSYSTISGATSSAYSFVTSGSTTIGSWSFELQVTDSANTPVVVKTTAVSVTAKAAPTVTVSPTLWAMDVGQSKTFTASPEGGSGSYTGYQWYVDSVLQSGMTASTFSYSPAASGSYTISLTVTDSLGATSVQSTAASVAVAASPTVSIAPAGPLSMDAGQIQTFTSTASGGSGTINYQWYLDGSAVGSNSASYSYTAAAGTHSVTCKVTDSASTPVTSPISNQVTVTVNPTLVAPTVTPTPGTIDQGQTSSLTSTAVTTGTSPNTYQWLAEAPGAGSYVDVGTNSSSYVFVTSGSTATGTWSFELQITDATKSQVTSTAVEVELNAAPSVTVSPTSWTMDVGQTKTLSAAAGGGSGTYTSYQWYVDGSAQSGQTASTFNYSPPSAGSYAITATVTDSLGATSAQSSASTVTVSASPTVSITPVGPVTMAVGQSTIFTANSGGGSGIYTVYQWYVDGSAQAGAAASTFSFSPASAGSYSVTATVIDSFGETSAQSSAVTATVNQLTIAITQTANGQISPGASRLNVNYDATPSFTITPAIGYHITSITADGTSVTITSPSGQSYQFSPVSVDGSLTAAFAINTYTLTVTQNNNGVISPGTTTVNYDVSQTFSITPNTGYFIASLTVDGRTVAAASSYTFSNVQASHTISATFAITSSPTPIVPSPSPTPKVSLPSPTPQRSLSTPTPIVSLPSPTPKKSTPSPTPIVSPSSPTPKKSSPKPTPLYAVLVAVIIVAAIITLLFSVIAIMRLKRKSDSNLPNPENKNEKINVLADNEKQEIASLKVKIEKIKDLEAEKKNLLLEIEELKNRADA